MSKSGLSKLLSEFWTPFFEASHPILHWPLVPIMFGVTLFASLAPVFFVANIVGLGSYSIRHLALVLAAIFGIGALGSLCGGILHHLLGPSRKYRVLCAFLLAGLVWGISFAGWYAYLDRAFDSRWMIALFVSGVALGVVLGIGVGVPMVSGGRK